MNMQIVACNSSFSVYDCRTRITESYTSSGDGECAVCFTPLMSVMGPPRRSGSCKSRFVYTGSTKGIICEWEIGSWDLMREIDVFGVIRELTTNGVYLYAALEGGCIVTIDLSTWEILNFYRDDRTNTRVFIATRDGLMCARIGPLLVWKTPIIETYNTPMKLAFETDEVSAAAIDYECNLVYYASMDVMRIWHYKTGLYIRAVQLGGKISSLFLHDDVLIMLTQRNTMYHIELIGEKVHRIQLPPNILMTCEFMTPQKRLFARISRRLIVEIDAKNGRYIQTIENANGWKFCVI